MDTYHNNLPLKENITSISVSSTLIAILMTIVSIAGIRFRTAIYPTEELIRAFVPNDVVILCLGLPVLLGSMWLTWCRNWIGLLCWPGALFFISYNSLAYIFAMPLNGVFLLHLGLVISSLYTLTGLIAAIDGMLVRQSLSAAVPGKLGGGVLAGLGSLFFLRAIVVLINALADGTPLEKPELAVSIADLSTTPAWVVGGILLWRRKAFGYVTGLGLLFQGSLLFLALIVFLLIQPLLTAAPFAITDMIVIIGTGLICFVPFAFFVQGVAAKTRASPVQH